jgi:TATA-binding protein-associated factor
VAQTFNGDSDIKILLVTKAIGGVGLNLSSANCVIMFDSDYNPTVDMQAIDRAHRIGQKRVLNVYRLITKDTLEEKIMGIQKFKTNLANAIVNIDNSSIKNIKESKLPELLESVRDLQKTSKEVEEKINKSMYGAIVAEMEKNAI